MKLTRNAKILSLWDSGLSAPAIAERFGMSPHMVRVVLRKAGKDLSVKRQRYDGEDGGSVWKKKASGRSAG